MEDNPFESLTKGFHKDPTLVFNEGKPEQMATPSTIQVASALSSGGLSYFFSASNQRKAHHAFEPLSDRFIEPLVVFPMANKVVINRYGAFVPQSIFGHQAQITYEQERTPDGTIRVSVHPTLNPHPVGIPQFGSARGLITISDDFDDPLEDFADYM